MIQVPHVLWTHACPPPHWPLDEHGPQAPLMQARPEGSWPGARLVDWLQSANVEHGLHAPAMHASPFAQSEAD